METTLDAFDRVTSVLGCKWTMAILEQVGRGVNRPGRLERALPGLTTKVLNQRIRKLERLGLIVRHDFGEKPARVEYEFTPRGRELLALVREVRAFAERWEQAGD